MEAGEGDTFAKAATEVGEFTIDPEGWRPNANWPGKQGQPWDRSRSRNSPPTRRIL
jgi:hypothetical protein